jgi:hypothetical protein
MKERNYKVDADVVKTEEKNRLSRDEKVLMPTAAKLVPGVLLGTVTSAGADKDKVKVWSPGATDGSQTVTDVLLENVPVTTSDRRVVTLARHAEVVLQSLVRPAGATDAQWAAALASLTAKSIVPRNGV